MNNFFHATICTFLLLSALNHASWYVARFIHEIHDHEDYLTHFVAKEDCIKAEAHKHHDACQICETLNQLKPEGTGSDFFITDSAVIFSQMIPPMKHEWAYPDNRHFGIRAPPIV